MSLPSLPLPALEETLAKLARSVRAVSDDEEYAETLRAIEDFKQGVGRGLHSTLASRAASERNWLEEMWEQVVYLRPRWPIAVWSNYLGTQDDQQVFVPAGTGPLGAAALKTLAVLQFRADVLADKLAPDTLLGRKLDMSQYKRMFHACRVPRTGGDEIVRYPPGEARHIVVLKDNAMCALTVLDAKGAPLPLADILAGMRRCAELCERGLDAAEPEAPVSVLTGEDRDVWAKARAYLSAHHRDNAASLAAIESALFLVVLEREAPVGAEQRAASALLGIRNRWYDKPFNLIVWRDGTTGLNGEHTGFDAMVVIRMQGAVVRAMAAHVAAHGYPTADGALVTSPAYVPPRKLVWHLDGRLLDCIGAASARLGSLAASVQLRVLQFPHFGRAFLKRLKLTPDFAVQMAIQLAYWRLHKAVVPTYESAHTRLYHHGRTETVRSATLESAAFCRAMTDAAASDAARLAALETAVAAHGELVKEALQGRGIDRHLLGLQVVATVKGMDPLPRLFTDAGFARSRKFTLSTSNASGPSSVGGYAPFFAGGYGVCYNIQERSINVTITHIVGGTTDAGKLRECLAVALVDVARVAAPRRGPQPDDVPAAKL